MYGQYSDYEIKYRCYMVAANLMDDGNTFIARSPAYDGLDPSEKGAVSYFTGLAVGKLFCELYLSIPWMMHLEVYQDDLVPMIYNSTKRPDLVGLDIRNRWTIMESKGRTNGIDNTLVNKAKTQTRAIRRIAGRFPFRRLAFVSHFSDGVLEAYWKDPNGYDDDASDLAIRQDDFLADYYRPFLSLIRRYGEQKTGEDPTAQLPDLDMTFSMESTTYRLLSEERYRDVRVHLRDTPVDRTDNPTYKRGRDGIAIRIGKRWVDESGKLTVPKSPFKRR